MTTVLPVRHPARRLLLVHCPVWDCEELTGRLDGPAGYAELTSAAAGKEDGFRCAAHSRTEAQRWEESMRALSSLRGRSNSWSGGRW